uniref:protein MMS22-like n=1 Tax=Myxine glutinosa TaxID=7769 RepID=UPI00358EBBC6
MSAPRGGGCGGSVRSSVWALILKSAFPRRPLMRLWRPTVPGPCGLVGEWGIANWEMAMETDFEGSLTPPCSPCSEPAFTQLEIFPSFSCLYSSPDSSRTENHLAYGCLKRMFLHLDPSPCCFERDTTSLFGFPVVTETALFDSPGLLFGLLRQQVLRLEALVVSCSSNFDAVQRLHAECEALQLKCARFLSYCKAAVFRWFESPSSEHLRLHPSPAVDVFRELHSLLLFLGRLSDVPVTPIMTPNSKVFSPSWYLLHLHLDLRWSVLEILQILSHCTADSRLWSLEVGLDWYGPTTSPSVLLDEQCTSLLYDLIAMATRRHNQLSFQEELATSPFYCACTRDLWILLQNLLDHRADGSDRKVRNLVSRASTRFHGESSSLLETCRQA